MKILKGAATRAVQHVLEQAWEKSGAVHHVFLDIWVEADDRHQVFKGTWEEVGAVHHVLEHTGTERGALQQVFQGTWEETGGKSGGLLPIKNNFSFPTEPISPNGFSTKRPQVRHEVTKERKP